ncbi:hypothetical protein ACS0TY_021640 [Phlomoides rotata]
MLEWEGSDNVSLSVGTSQSTDVGGTPILNPQVTIPRGRSRSRRYMSAIEVTSRGRGRRGGGIQGGARGASRGRELLT